MDAEARDGGVRVNSPLAPHKRPAWDESSKHRFRLSAVSRRTSAQTLASSVPSAAFQACAVLWKRQLLYPLRIITVRYNIKKRATSFMDSTQRFRTTVLARIQP